VFAQFELGQKFEHHWGRTLRESDATTFTCLTLNYNPLYVNDEFARSQGHPTAPVNPYLTFLTVVGLSVEDMSEGSAEGAFLGVDNLTFAQPVFPGDTLNASSEVIGLRASGSRPGSGIVTWRTTGSNQRGEDVITFDRTVLVGKTPSS
jgi:acyl dehydratase